MSDWATIVSVLPFPVREIRHGVYPRLFVVPAAELGTISTCHVCEGYFKLYIDAERGSIKVPVPPVQLANSIVGDYKSSFLGVTDGAAPGLMVVPGKLEEDEIKEKYTDQLFDLRQVQVRWFERLVKIADDDWQRYHQHKMITDIQRFACTSLQFEREWNVDASKLQFITCKACKSNIHPEAIVCPICRIVQDDAKYAEMTSVS